MFFLTSIFKEIINTKQNQWFKNKIFGVKFILKGKIRGKLRASSQIIEVGLVPTQSIDKNIQFAKITSYTLLGTFGMKLWIFTKN
jgi:ribosomal protein S3